MTNIYLFIVTLVVWFFAWCYLAGDPINIFRLPWNASTPLFGGWKKALKRIIILTVLFIPFNNNDNIYTIAGNVVSEKSAYSVVSFYQNAEKDAFSILGFSTVQMAKNNAIVVVGFSLYQKAEETALVAGFSLIQKAVIGSSTMIGVSAFQSAGNLVDNPCSLNLYREVPGKEQSFAIFSKITR
jgi:hypothetical protein